MYKGFLFFILLLVFIGCAEYPQKAAISKPTYRLTTVFNDEELIQYAGKGAGIISGQVILKSITGDQKYVSGTSVLLMPKTSYTSDISRGAITGATIERLDPRVNKYIRGAKADTNGRFEFKDLPQGEYIIGCSIKWQVPTQHGLKWIVADIHEEVDLRKGGRVEIQLIK